MTGAADGPPDDPAVAKAPPLLAAGGGRIVLASASPTRRAMLAAAGVPFDAEPARVDEAELKRGLRGEGAGAVDIAEVLAEAKARYVARRHGGTPVLGADQVLDCDGETFDKPVDRADAVDQLRRLRGRSHELISYAVIVRDGERIWHAVDRARLTMRDFSDDFVEAYLDAAGSDAFNGPGGYRVESIGAQLFARIEGSHYTILGLPLLALLEYLRVQEILPR